MFGEVLCSFKGGNKGKADVTKGWTSITSFTHNTRFSSRFVLHQKKSSIALGMDEKKQTCAIATKKCSITTNYTLIHKYQKK